MASPYRFVFASDSFQGTLSSSQTASLLQNAARDQFADCQCVGIPMADGGEGTAEALVAACGGELRGVDVHDPLGRPIRASYGLLGDRRAVIEMAAASGQQLLMPEERDPLMTSSYGTGELISDALAQGCDDVTIALGGSAANDGGMGCMRALGVRFLDENGAELAGVGRDLALVRSIDLSLFRLYVGETRFRVMCDVRSPLLGEEGATLGHAASRGATDEVARELERGMARYADVLDAVFGRASGVSVRDQPGSGAAGGLGAACAAFHSARLDGGIESILELVRFDDILATADLCVTGEGRLDGHTGVGKVVSGVAAACARQGVPCVAIVGEVERGDLPPVVRSLTAVVPTVESSGAGEEALDHAEELYVRAARRLFSLVAVGAGLGA